MNFTDNLFRNGSNDESVAFGNYAQPLTQTYADDAGQDPTIAIALPTEHFDGYTKPVSYAHPGWYNGVSKHAFGYRDANKEKGGLDIKDFYFNESAKNNGTDFIERFTSNIKGTDNNTYYNFLTQKNDLPNLPEEKAFRHSGNLLAKASPEEEGIDLPSVNTRNTTGFGYMPSGGFFKGYEL